MRSKQECYFCGKMRLHENPMANHILTRYVESLSLAVCNGCKSSLDSIYYEEIDKFIISAIGDKDECTEKRIEKEKQAFNNNTILFDLIVVIFLSRLCTRLSKEKQLISPATGGQ